MRKVKTIKFTVLHKGDTIDYQTVIEEIIGDQISKLSCYDPNNNNDKKYGDIYDPEGRAYFNPDFDYELIIRPKK